MSEDAPAASRSKEDFETPSRLLKRLPIRKRRSTVVMAQDSDSPPIISMFGLDLMDVDDYLPITPRRTKPRPIYSTSSASSSKASTSSSSGFGSSRLTRPAPSTLEPLDPDTLPHKVTYAVAQRQLKLNRIQGNWDRAAESVGAATVTIVNDIDDELVLLPEDFRYLEQSYMHRVPEVADEFLFGCHCMGACKDPADCCGENAIFPFSPVVRVFALHPVTRITVSKGVFLFHPKIPHNSLIIECNKVYPLSSSQNYSHNSDRTVPATPPVETESSRNHVKSRSRCLKPKIAAGASEPPSKSGVVKS